MHKVAATAVRTIAHSDEVDRLSKLAAFASTLRRHDLPDDVASRAKLMLLDLLGVLISGSGQERVQRMAGALRKRGSQGRSVVVGHGASFDAADAAMINGTAGCVHVLEDGHKHARGHFSNNILPALLAVSDEQGISGTEFLTTFVAAYEVAARVTLACKIRHEMHSSGTTHTIGTTAGVARLMGFSPADIREAMNVAAPLTLATSWNAAEDGATVRDLYAGKAGSNAIWAPRWVLSGFTGSDDDVSYVFRNVTSDRNFNASILDRGLSEDWEIRHSYFKIHSCCRTIQSSIDAALKIRANPDFKSEQVSRVTVETFQMPIDRNSRREARNEIAAKESQPIALALTLIHGHCNETLFTRERVFAEETKALVSKIEIKCDPALEALCPQQNPARVRVELKDGRTLESYFPVAVGDPMKPLTPEQIEEKFFRLTEGVLGARARELRVAVDNIDNLASMADLTGLLAAPIDRISSRAI